MKAEDYVRTKYGIKQIYEIDNNKTVWKYKFKLKKQDGDGCIDLGCFSDSDVIKSSERIIDLIQIGDYVNGMKITNKYIDEETGNIELEFNNGSSYLYPKSWNYEARSEEYKIKSIVTKEQFSQMEYRIGE